MYTVVMPKTIPSVFLNQPLNGDIEEEFFVGFDDGIGLGLGLRILLDNLLFRKSGMQFQESISFVGFQPVVR